MLEMYVLATGKLSNFRVLFLHPPRLLIYNIQAARTKDEMGEFQGFLA